MLPSIWGRRLAAVYLLLVAFAGGFLTYHVLFSPQSTQYLAIPFVIAGLPWYVILARAFDPDAAGAILLVLAFSIGFNAVILYWLGSRLEQLRQRRVREAG